MTPKEAMNWKPTCPSEMFEMVTVRRHRHLWERAKHHHDAGDIEAWCEACDALGIFRDKLAKGELTSEHYFNWMNAQERDQMLMWFMRSLDESEQ